jgi:hypothetical protein
MAPGLLAGRVSDAFLHEVHLGVRKQAPAFANGLGDGDLALAGDSHRRLRPQVRNLLAPPPTALRHDHATTLRPRAERSTGLPEREGSALGGMADLRGQNAEQKHR